MYKLVLLRHGQSTWNLENRFTGWTDVGLSEQGYAEAHAAGKLLKEGGYVFDLAYTSVLRRAIQTLWIVLEEMGLEWIPVINAWQLNERHYGALAGTEQGRNGAEVWGGTGEDLAAQLRCPAARRLSLTMSAIPSSIRAMPRLNAGQLPGNRVAQNHARTGAARTGTARWRRSSSPASASSLRRMATACARWSSTSTISRMRKSPN